MPIQHLTELPDPIYGSALSVPNPSRVLRVRGDNLGVNIEVNIGAIYVSMSSENWVEVIDAIQAVMKRPKLKLVDVDASKCVMPAALDEVTP